MGRSSLFEQRFRYNLGIHEQPNFAQLDHCKDCRNVWAPEGELVSRPGSEPLNVKFLNHQLTKSSPTEMVAHFYDATGASYSTAVSGASDLTLTGFTVADYLYLGIDSSDITTTLVGLQWVVGAANSVNISLHWEYYNGSAWKALKNAVLVTNTKISTTNNVCEGSVGDTQTLLFWLPSDAADYALNDGSNTYTKRYIRARNLVGTVTAGTRLDLAAATDAFFLELDTALETKIGFLHIMEEAKRLIMSVGWETDNVFKFAKQFGLGSESAGPDDVATIPGIQVDSVSSRAWVPPTGEQLVGVGDNTVISKYVPRSGGHIIGDVQMKKREADTYAAGTSWSTTTSIDARKGNLVVVLLYGYQVAAPIAAPTAATFGGKALTEIGYYVEPGATNDIVWAGYTMCDAEVTNLNLEFSWGGSVYGNTHIYEISGLSEYNTVFDFGYGWDQAVAGASPWQYYNTGIYSSTVQMDFAEERKGMTLLLMAKPTNAIGDPTYVEETKDGFVDPLVTWNSPVNNTVFSWYKRSRTRGRVYPTFEVTGNNHKYLMFGVNLQVSDVYVEPFEVEGEHILIGDPTSPTYEGYLAQLQEAPKARYVTYYKDHVFLAGIEGLPRMVRWSMAAPAHKVFSELGFTYVGGTEADELTGFIHYGEHLLVAEPTNIWRLGATEIDAFGVPHWEPAQFISGVGCINTRTAVNTVRGLVWLSDNGVMVFNGNAPKKVTDSSSKGQSTDRMADFWRRVNWGAAYSRSVAVDWKSKNCYLLALPIDGSQVNNIVLVWDYNNNTLWLWDNLDIQDMQVVTGLGEKEKVLFVDQNRVIWKLTNGSTDYYAKIPCSVTSHRINQGGSSTFKLRECEITATNTDSDVALSVYKQDESSSKDFTYDFTNTLDGDLIGASGSRLVTLKERSVKKSVRFTGERFKLVFSNGTTGKKFRLRDVFVRGLDRGRR